MYRLGTNNLIKIVIDLDGTANEVDYVGVIKNGYKDYIGTKAILYKKNTKMSRDDYYN